MAGFQLASLQSGDATSIELFCETIHTDGFAVLRVPTICVFVFPFLFFWAWLMFISSCEQVSQEHKNMFDKLARYTKDFFANSATCSRCVFCLNFVYFCSCVSLVRQRNVLAHLSLAAEREKLCCENTADPESRDLRDRLEV